MSGNLIVRPLSARLTHGTELFGKMDPLVKVIVGSHVQRTPAMKRGHKNPTWDTELSLRRTNEDIIRFEVWDKDILTKNDLIGAGELSFSRIFAQNGIFKDWVPLTYKNKSAGELLVSLEFIPDYGVSMADKAMVGGTTMGAMSTIPAQTTQPIVTQQPMTTTTQPLTTTTAPIITSTPYNVPHQHQQMMTTQTTQTMTQQPILQQPMAMSALPVSSERGFGQQSLTSGAGFTEPLDNLERARERDEGFVPGGVVGKDGRTLDSGYKEEKHHHFHHDKDYRDENLKDDKYYRDERLYREPYMSDVNRNQQFTQNQPLTQNQQFIQNQQFTPMQNVQTQDNLARGSYIPDQYRFSDQRADLIRSQNMQNVPGYSAGIVAYQPVGGPEGRWMYEPRFDERTWEQSRMPLQQQQFVQQPMIQQQPMMQQNYQQSQYGYVPQQENVPPNLKQDLNVIEQRIKTSEYRPLSSQNYENPLTKTKTGYQREQREYVPILPETKLATQTINTQLPGVISNPESKYIEGGKYVMHQGGTHSTVGSVQSHRIISRMADKPELGYNALDEDAKIALGDVPKSYYGDTTKATK